MSVPLYFKEELVEGSQLLLASLSAEPLSGGPTSLMTPRNIMCKMTYSLTIALKKEDVVVVFVQQVAI